jgi:UPF0271 protein
MKYIDINCDLGEGKSLIDCEHDAKIMPYISSCNIACGGHAGDESIIKQSLLNAKLNGLKVGAHPGYEDKANFGRISLDISVEEVVASIQKQLDLFLRIASELNIAIYHIKFHGALYNDLEKQPRLASKLAQLLKRNYASLKVYGLANGEFEKQCTDLNIEFVSEGFMDRTYLSSGHLTPRSEENAVLTEQDQSIAQAISLASNQEIKTSDGEIITPQVKTICLHGDNPEAITIAKALHIELTSAGFLIQ